MGVMWAIVCFTVTLLTNREISVGKLYCCIAPGGVKLV